MKLNLPKPARVGVYLATALGTPVVVYLKAKGYIGDLELTLWSAEVTAMSVLAGLNVGTAKSTAVKQLVVNGLDPAEVERALLRQRRQTGRG